eukprot:TRINITY_DN1154_c0_g2_i1.p1 TRINITY_DN1154_c0_g2~~TRINITY_DN1154_c0_g2_i1.p1  ORF type:complete len:107 (-),score=11.81 TRINITY_DN1154_c0_g2_i1:58-333(-)
MTLFCNGKPSEKFLSTKVVRHHQFFASQGQPVAKPATLMAKQASQLKERNRYTTYVKKSVGIFFFFFFFFFFEISFSSRQLELKHIKYRNK